MNIRDLAAAEWVLAKANYPAQTLPNHNLADRWLTLSQITVHRSGFRKHLRRRTFDLDLLPSKVGAVVFSGGNRYFPLAMLRMRVCPDKCLSSESAVSTNCPSGTKQSLKGTVAYGLFQIRIRASRRHGIVLDSQRSRR
jgi:hypothetical protein